MAPPIVAVELAPLSSDIPMAVELAREAILAAFSRSGPPTDAAPRIATVTARIRSGDLTEGRLGRVEGQPVGVALWETGHPSGITLQLLYLRRAVGRPPAYDAFFQRLTEQAGPAVFSPGGLVGLSDDEEMTLMRAHGFERFARSEMRWPPGGELPLVPAPEGVQIRPVRAEDEGVVAALHRAAFEGTFDQYLYLNDANPAVDAARAVHEMMTAQYGEFLGWASTLARSGDRPLGASLVVRAPYGPLLISVMVEPSAQGSGLGRALVGANLQALRARGETVAALNVTEGNLRAVRLYEHLGFVRTIGPEHAWYSRAAIPVAPGETVSDRSRSPTPDTKGSSANRTPRT
jgi:mycothiol synthase